MKVSASMRLSNINLATMDSQSSYGLIEQGTVVLEDNAIAWVGPEHDLPSRFANLEQKDFGGRLVTPALIDCHTHIVHGGHRADEFEMRLEGTSYEAIARTGGGIVSTVRATREAGFDTLLNTALQRVDSLIAEGVALIEIKSGYGLDRETELTMLRVARAIETHRPVRIRTSFLGAHSIPPEYKDKSDAYISEIVLPTLKAAHAESLVDAVDAFCEGIAFSAEQIERVFLASQALGIPVKLHAEQLSRLGGTAMASSFQALSSDHLEYATDADARAMAASGTVAVLLPGAFYTLGETQKPPIDAFRKHGVPIALATDCNPGSSPIESLLLIMNMACTLFGITPTEALAGVTKNAARALGMNDTGIIRAGNRADLAVWNVEHPAELAYRIGTRPLYQRIFAGC